MNTAAYRLGRRVIRKKVPAPSLEEMVRGLPDAVRPLLGSLHGMGDAYVASAISRLPYGTMTNLIGLEALTKDLQGDAGGGPQLTRQGRRLIAHLAATETTTIVVPSREQLIDAYRSLRKEVVDPNPVTFVLAPPTPNTVGAQDIRALRAQAQGLIADVLDHHDGRVEVTDQDGAVPVSFLLVEKDAAGVKVSGAGAVGSWSIMTESGLRIDEEPATLTLTPNDDIAQLADQLRGMRR